MNIKNVEKDALRFQYWIALATEQPGRVARALANCTSPDDYRAAIDTLIDEDLDAGQTQALDTLESWDELPGVLVTVGPDAVAWFSNAEHGSEWATENHFGQWLMAPYGLVVKPIFTANQIHQAMEDAKALMSKFSENPPRADEDEDDDGD